MSGNRRWKIGLELSAVYSKEVRKNIDSVLRVIENYILSYCEIKSG